MMFIKQSADTFINKNVDIEIIKDEGKRENEAYV